MDRAAARNGFTVTVFGLQDLETGSLTPWVSTRERAGHFDFRGTLGTALRARLLEEQRTLSR